MYNESIKHDVVANFQTKKKAWIDMDWSNSSYVFDYELTDPFAWSSRKEA
jgi:hypothetical protein